MVTFERLSNPCKEKKRMPWLTFKIPMIIPIVRVTFEAEPCSPAGLCSEVIYTRLIPIEVDTCKNRVAFAMRLSHACCTCVLCLLAFISHTKSKERCRYCFFKSNNGEEHDTSQLKIPIGRVAFATKLSHAPRTCVFPSSLASPIHQSSHRVTSKDHS